MVFGGKKIIVIIAFFCALLGFLVGIFPLYTQLCIVETQSFTSFNCISVFILAYGIDIYMSAQIMTPCFTYGSIVLDLFATFSTMPISTIIEIRFRTANEYVSSILFFAMQERIFVSIGETSLVFFRIENTTVNTTAVYVLYYVYPEELRLFLYKVQCFCFAEIFIDPHMLLDVPVLFYVATSINKSICYLCYVLF